MNLVEAIAIFILGMLPYSVIDRFVIITPFDQAAVDAVLVGVDEASGPDGLLNQRFDGGLLDTLRVQHLNDPLSPTLQHPEDRWFLLNQSTSSPFTFEPTATDLGGPDGSPLQDGLCDRQSGRPHHLITFDLTFQEDGLFSPRYRYATRWSSVASPPCSTPVSEQSADWTGSAPSDTDIPPQNFKGCSGLLLLHSFGKSTPWNPT